MTTPKQKNYRVFDYTNIEVQRLLGYLQRVNYNICFKIESNPKPYLEFQVQNTKYKTFLRQIFDIDILTDSMTLESNINLANYIGREIIDNLDFVSDILKLQKMITILNTRYTFLKSDRTPKDYRPPEYAPFDKYLQNIEIANKNLTRYYNQLKNNKLRREDYTIEINFYDNLLEIINKMLIIIGTLDDESPYTILNSKLNLHIRRLEDKLETNLSDDLLSEINTIQSRIKTFTRMIEELQKLLEDYTNIKEGVETLPEFRLLQDFERDLPTNTVFYNEGIDPNDNPLCPSKEPFSYPDHCKSFEIDTPLNELRPRDYLSNRGLKLFSEDKNRDCTEYSKGKFKMVKDLCIKHNKQSRIGLYPTYLTFKHFAVKRLEIENGVNNNNHSQRNHNHSPNLSRNNSFAPRHNNSASGATFVNSTPNNSWSWEN